MAVMRDILDEGPDGAAELLQKCGVCCRLLGMCVEPIQLNVVDARLQSCVDQLGNRLQPLWRGRFRDT